MFSVSTTRLGMLFTALLTICSCTTDGSQDEDKTPDPDAPALSALSLLQYFYYRGGGTYSISVPISPAFNPVVFDYSASSEAGPIAVVPETGTPDTKMTVTFNNQIVTASLDVNGKPRYNGNVPGGAQSDFSVVLRDTVKDLETTYRIQVEAR